MFKYREIRMLALTAIIFIAVNVVVVVALANRNMLQVALGLLLSFSSLLLLLTRYKMTIFNDSVMIYEFKGIGILPVLLDFEDIREVKVAGKHKLVIDHGRLSTVHVVNAVAFGEELKLKMQSFANQNK